MSTANPPTSKYAQYTVKELKQMIKDRNAISFGHTKKADLIQDLEDHDAHEKSMANMAKWSEKLIEDGKKVKELKEQAVDAVQKAKSTIAVLKQKENKTSEDYEKIINLYDSLLNLARFV